MKGVVRPYAREFIIALAELFRICLWSSMKPENITYWIDTIAATHTPHRHESALRDAKKPRGMFGLMCSFDRGFAQEFPAAFATEVDTSAKEEGGRKRRRRGNSRGFCYG